jgi:hypothetical protein
MSELQQPAPDGSFPLLGEKPTGAPPPDAELHAQLVHIAAALGPIAAAMERIADALERTANALERTDEATE